MDCWNAVYLTVLFVFIIIILYHGVDEAKNIIQTIYDNIMIIVSITINNTNRLGFSAPQAPKLPKFYVIIIV